MKMETQKMIINNNSEEKNENINNNFAYSMNDQMINNELFKGDMNDSFGNNENKKQSTFKNAGKFEEFLTNN